MNSKESTASPPELPRSGRRWPEVLALIISSMCLLGITTVVAAWVASHKRMVEVAVSTPHQVEGHMLYLAYGKGWYDQYRQGAPRFNYWLTVHPADSVQPAILNANYPESFRLFDVCCVLAIWPACFWLRRIFRHRRRV